MKTKEFIKSVEALGFQTHVREKEIRVCDEMRGYGIDSPMFILTSDLPEVYTQNELYISSLERRGVLKLIVEYLDTPNSEREEEKRYYLRLATKIDVYEDRRYLNMDIPNEKYTLSENKDDAYYKASFTESEIAEMDITGFQKVEVTECWEET